MEIVQTLLEKMGGLGKPQMKVLTTLFATILIACGKVNFVNLSRYSTFSERTYRRAFNRAFPFTSFNLEVIKAAMTENPAMIVVMEGCQAIHGTGGLPSP